LPVGGVVAASSAARAHSLTLCPAAAAKDSSRANSSSVNFVPTDRVRAAAPFLLEVAATAGKLLPKTLHPFRAAAKRVDWKTLSPRRKFPLCGNPLGVTCHSIFQPPKATSGIFRLYDGNLLSA
jgi:hypothetical protein